MGQGGKMENNKERNVTLFISPQCHYYAAKPGYNCVGNTTFVRTCRHSHPAGYGVWHQGRFVSTSLEDLKETIHKCIKAYGDDFFEDGEILEKVVKSHHSDEEIIEYWWQKPLLNLKKL